MSEACDASMDRQGVSSETGWPMQADIVPGAADD